MGYKDFFQPHFVEQIMAKDKPALQTYLLGFLLLGVYINGTLLSSVFIFDALPAKLNGLVAGFVLPIALGVGVQRLEKRIFSRTDSEMTAAGACIIFLCIASFIFNAFHFGDYVKMMGSEPVLETSYAELRLTD